LIWDSWSAFWNMGGRGFFVWGSYGVLLVAVVAELVALKQARNNALKALREDHDHDH